MAHQAEESILFRSLAHQPALKVVTEEADGVHAPWCAACSGLSHQGPEAAGEVDDHADTGADQNNDVHHLHNGALRQIRGKSWRSALNACTGVSMGATATSEG